MSRSRSRGFLTTCIAACLTLGTVGLTACTDTPTVTASDPGAHTSPIPQFDHEDTLWTIEGTNEPLSLEDVDVQALQNVIARHSGIADTRSAETIGDSADAEQKFFSPLFAEQLATQGYSDALVALYTENELTIEQTGAAWLESTISADRNFATVGYESIFRIAAATEGYLHQLDSEPGQEFAQPREYTLTKVDGTWLIENIVKGPLRKTSAASP